MTTWKPNPAQQELYNMFQGIKDAIHEMIFDDIKENGWGADKYLYLKNIQDNLDAASNSFFDGLSEYSVRMAWAVQEANEAGLEIPGLRELAAELTDENWGEKADRLEQSYPHMN